MGTIKIVINKNQVYYPSRILKTPEEHLLGYQFIEEDDLEPNECLLFVFDDIKTNRTFHMQNCDSFDIKLYALDQNKNLVDSFVMKKGSNMKYSIKGPCKYVVEVPMVLEP